jgi:uncharacterized caspase-like protein
MARVALLVGIERYEHLDELTTPYQDVRLLGKALIELGFEVMELGQDSPARDQTALRNAFAELRRRIEDFSAPSAAGCQPCVIVYFAGHGAIVGGQSYLVGETADPISDGALRSGSVPLNELIAELGVRLDVPKVLLIDACQSHVRSRSFLQQAHSLAVLPGDMIVDFATIPGESALDGVAHSPYALALSEHLKDPVTIGDVLISVTARVRELTGLRQNPLSFVSMGVKLVIGQTAAAATAPSMVLTNAALARMRHRIFLFQSTDPAGRSAWYAILLHEGMERAFAPAIVDTKTVDLSQLGTVLAVAYGETLSDALRRYLKSRYGL